MMHHIFRVSTKSEESINERLEQIEETMTKKGVANDIFGDRERTFLLHFTYNKHWDFLVYRMQLSLLY